MTVPGPRRFPALLRALPSGAQVLDVGCHGFRVRERALREHRADLKHAGVDYSSPGPVPDGVEFRSADLNVDRLPFDSDRFDLVVANHVIEHLRDPIAFFGECVRVCKPGGYLHFEAPSERTLRLPGFPFAHDRFHSFSFYDDPTHIGRPFSPQAWVRLASSFGCDVVVARYMTNPFLRLLAVPAIPIAFATRQSTALEGFLWALVGWASALIAQKPVSLRGTPTFRYLLPEKPESGLLKVFAPIVRWMKEQVKST